MFTFDSISGPFLFGKDMPTILGLRLMDAGVLKNLALVTVSGAG
jgi:hypothetical protein